MDNILPRPNTIERHIRQTTADKFEGIPHFKGIIQDVQVIITFFLLFILLFIKKISLFINITQSQNLGMTLKMFNW